MKTILSAIFTVALVSVLVGAGTFAYYTDTEMSGDNTFTSGTMDLVLTDGQPNPNAQWTISNGAPGADVVGADGDIRIHSLGTINADNVEIAFSFDKYEDDNGDGDDGYVFGPEPDLVDGVGKMASALKVYDMKYRVVVGGSTIETINLVHVNSGYYFNPAYLTDTNLNGYIDLEDLEDPVNTLVDLPPSIAIDAAGPNYTDYTQLSMAINLIDTGVSQNEFQGDIIDMTITVTLNQDES